MKPLAIWLLAFAAVFGALAIATSVLRDTTRVFVVIDSSFPMGEVWTDALAELDRIEGRDHAEFALATEKEFVHSWGSELTLGPVDPFAPCTFEGIDSYDEIAGADELVLITTPGSCDASSLLDWEIILLEP